MEITITPIKNPALLAAGYTHEYLVRNVATDLATRNGITKGMTWRKFGQLLRGEVLDK